jgi:hypothetical protein
MTVGVASVDKPRIEQVGVSAENLPGRNCWKAYREAATPANPGRTHQPPAAGTLCLAARLARAKAEAAA